MAACERKGMVSLVFINVFGRSPEEAVSLSIWLHGGTLAAAIYFRLGLSDILSDIPDYIRACPAKKEKGPLIHFLAVSTVISGIIGAPLLLYVTESLLFPDRS